MSSITLEKAKSFALRVIRLYKYLTEEKKEFILSKQLLRSGTSVGANLTEAQCANSKKDFLFKSHIAFKECAETKYWLELLFKAEYLSEREYYSINDDCTELVKLLTAITKSTAKNLRDE